ncbi:MAG: hypothetical protein AAF708_02785, partial [Deinococcota bacterium]
MFATQYPTSRRLTAFVTASLISLSLSSVSLGETTMTTATLEQAPVQQAESTRRMQTPMTLEDVQAYAVGEWASISMELRPTEDRAGSGQIQPTHLKRHFSYLSKDEFVGVITQYADIAGEVPLVEFEFKGSLVWGNQHPIVEGAWTIDYVLDEGFAITA